MTYPMNVRMKVVRAVDAGMSQVQAAKEHGVSVPTVKRWVKRRRAGESLEDRPRPGAPPILSPEEVAWLGALVEAQPRSSLDDLVDALDQRAGKRVSTATIRRALAKAGLRRVRPKIQKTDDATGPQRDRYRPHQRREPELGRYPSSLTDHEWALLEDEFDNDGPPVRGRPRVHEPRELLDAVFYIVRTGCAWRYLPAEFPPWQTVYSAFRAWSSRGSFERMHQLLASEWRTREGRSPEPTAGIIDSQTAKTTEKGGLEVGTVRNA